MARVARMRPASVTLTSAPSFSAGFKGCDGLEAGMRSFGAGGISIHAFGAQLFDFSANGFFQVMYILAFLSISPSP